MTAVSVNRCCADPGTAPPLTMPRSLMVCLIDLVTVAAGIALVGGTPVRFLPAVRSRRRRIAGAVSARLPPLRRHAPSFGYWHRPAFRLKPMNTAATANEPDILAVPVGSRAAAVGHSRQWPMCHFAGLPRRAWSVAAAQCSVPLPVNARAAVVWQGHRGLLLVLLPVLKCVAGTPAAAPMSAAALPAVADWSCLHSRVEQYSSCAQRRAQPALPPLRAMDWQPRRTGYARSSPMAS
jgi:hypothetical protein